MRNKGRKTVSYQKKLRRLIYYSVQHGVLDWVLEQKKDIWGKTGKME